MLLLFALLMGVAGATDLKGLKVGDTVRGEKRPLGLGNALGTVRPAPPPLA